MFVPADPRPDDAPARLPASTAQFYRGLPALAGGFAVASGALVMAGWVFDVAALKSLLPSLATMKVNSALSFIFLGLALLLEQNARAGTARGRAVAGLALSAMVIAALTLMEYLAGVSFGIDQLLIADSAGALNAHPGRMSPATAVNFLLTGIALAQLARRPKLAQALAIAVGGIALFALVGYLYGVKSLYALFSFSSMALPTASAFFILSLGLLLARPAEGLTGIVLADSPSGVLARRLLPVAVLIPVALGWLRLAGQKGGLYDLPTGTALLAISLVAIFTGLILRTATILEETEARYRVMVERSPDAIIVQSDGVILMANPAAAELLRAPSAGALAGRPVLEILPAGDREAVHLRLEQIAAGVEVPSVRERSLLRLDGTLVEVEVAVAFLTHRGRPATQAFIRDVTERKCAEEARRSSEARYRTLFDTLIEGFCTIEMIFDEDGKAVDYRFLEINPAFEKQTGLHDAQGKLMRELAPDHEEHWFEIYGKIALTGESVQFENEAKALGRHYDVCAYRVGGPESRKVAILFNDITARKRTEVALLRRGEELARSNAELERFAYVASHDLQEPLRMVASYLQLLQRRYRGRLDADADEFIAFAVDGASRMKALINDLLALSRVGTGGNPFGPVESGKALQRALDNLQVAVEESGAAVSHGALPAVHGDEAQLTQLLQNLIGNAIKFHGAAPPRISVGAARENGHWHFSVRDNGIGIDPQYFDRVFLIFQRLHNREEFSGTGIGLAICKKIVERHQGKIWIESQPGRGATFHFTLPAVDASAANPLAMESA